MKRRWLWIPLAAFGLALTVGAGALYAYDAARADVIAEGVTVAGVDVGGLERSAAAAKLRRELVPLLVRPLTATHEGRRFVLDPGEAALEVDVEGMASAAVAAGRDGNFLARAYRDVRGRPLDAALSVQLTYSPDAVDAFVARIRKRVVRPPQSARLVPSAVRLRVVRSQKGVAVRLRRLRRAVVAQLVTPEAARVLAVPTKTRPPKVSTADLKRKNPVYLTLCRSCYELRLWVGLRLRKTYRVAVGGQGYATPSGLYTINDKQVNPYWHVPRSPWTGALAGRIIPPGPSNPIKVRWMGFYNGAGIHGTDAVYSLGTAASHGCIRMSIPDVIELYDRVPTGTPIFVA